MNFETIKDLYAHMEWADAMVWRAVISSESATTDKRVRELFHHLHLVQHAYLIALRREAMPAEFPTFEDTHALMSWGRTSYPEISRDLESMDDNELSTHFEMPWTGIVTKQLGRAPEPVTLGEFMMQVPLHSLYHRGQINARLREVGGEPPTVDYLVWHWLGKPLADWS